MRTNNDEKSIDGDGKSSETLSVQKVVDMHISNLGPDLKKRSERGSDISVTVSFRESMKGQIGGISKVIEKGMWQITDIMSSIP